MVTKLTAEVKSLKEQLAKGGAKPAPVKPSPSPSPSKPSQTNSKFIAEFQRFVDSQPSGEWTDPVFPPNRESLNGTRPKN